MGGDARSLGAKSRGSRYRVLADRYRNGEADSDVRVYAAGGYHYPGKNIEQLLVEMQRCLDLGYRTVKIKIGGASLAAQGLMPLHLARAVIAEASEESALTRFGTRL